LGETLVVDRVATVTHQNSSTRLLRERLFFSGMTVAFTVAVFIGFAPTYFLRSLSDRPALPWLVHLHGALFSAWILLLLVQTTLVAVKRTDLHRLLGVGGVLAVSMIPVGYFVAISAARR
jgi:hypothetical protein